MGTPDPLCCCITSPKISLGNVNARLLLRCIENSCDRDDAVALLIEWNHRRFLGRQTSLLQLAPEFARSGVCNGSEILPDFFDVLRSKNDCCHGGMHADELDRGGTKQNAMLVADRLDGFHL